MADADSQTTLPPPAAPAPARRFKIRADDAVTRLADGKGNRRRGGHLFGRQPVVLELDPDGNADHAAILADAHLIVVELGADGRPLPAEPPAELKSERLQAETSGNGAQPPAKTTAKPPPRPKSKAAKRR